MVERRSIVVERMSTESTRMTIGVEHKFVALWFTILYIRLCTLKFGS